MKFEMIFLVILVAVCLADLRHFAEMRKETKLTRVAKEKENELKEREIELYSTAIKSQLIKFGCYDLLDSAGNQKINKEE